jgi:predicted RNA-binding Zn-ribbon protein involved in translation (DUF1610 family)
MGSERRDQNAMDDFVPEEAIDYEEVFRRGGRNLGDEDFALFKCPHCGCIYLLEYEVDTVYLDAGDLSRRVAVDSGSFNCETCGEQVPEYQPWAGPRAGEKSRVTWGELRASDWAWVVKQPGRGP